MAERETREQAQERILDMQGVLMDKLFANPKYQELDPISQDQVVELITPRLFDPKYEISKLLHSIAVSKSLIRQANSFAARSPGDSELAAEVVKGERQSIQYDLEEIKRIQKGEFEWVN